MSDTPRGLQVQQKPPRRKEKEVMLYRQGDVLITRIDAMPKGARRLRREHGRVVLAHGEVTGHAHAIADRGADLYALTDTEVDDRFLSIVLEGGADLVHEEHATIHLPAGSYLVRRQREYTSADMPARVVAD